MMSAECWGAAVVVATATLLFFLPVDLGGESTESPEAGDSERGFGASFLGVFARVDLATAGGEAARAGEAGAGLLPL